MGTIKKYVAYNKFTDKFITNGTSFKTTLIDGRTIGIYKENNKRSLLNYIHYFNGQIPKSHIIIITLDEFNTLTGLNIK